MSDDKKDALRWLEREGWTITDCDRHHVATHPEATAPIEFGGRHGWSLTRIRHDAARARGKRTKMNRRKADKAFRATQAAEAAAAREAALTAQIKAEQHAAPSLDTTASPALLALAADLGRRRGWRVCDHAAARMVERGITRLELVATLQNPVDVSLDGDRPVYAGRDVLAVVDAIDLVVVTVYRGTLADHRERMPQVAS